MRRARPDGPQETATPQLTAQHDVAAQDRQETDPRLKEGLHFLLDGCNYASEVGRDRWEFAVEIESLYRAGLINNDLRWLVGKGYVEHAIESTTKGNGARRFRQTACLALSGRSCFVLTDAGVEWSQQVLASSGRAIFAAAGVVQTKDGQTHPAVLPHWDADEHTLYWRGEVVKHFKREAPCQEAVLAAFQAYNWARCAIVDLPKDEGVSPKERLRETIKNLNHSFRGKIHFTQEGNGSRVGWQALD